MSPPQNQPEAPRRAAVDEAQDGLAAVRQATAVLRDSVGTLDDAGARAASALPGWTRGHVVTHLARNADALVNLLTWARTGVEHPMYTSLADRDESIEEGAVRSWQLLHEDLEAACDRFEFAASQLSDEAWSAEVASRQGKRLSAHVIPRMRLAEVWLHLVDLDHGVSVDDIPSAHLPPLLDHIVRGFSGRPGIPPVQMRLELPDGEVGTWEVGSGEPAVVRGRAAVGLAWLSGRGDGSGLSGELPTLPAWP